MHSLGDQRAMTPVVSKTLAIGIALLYVGTMTTLLFGSVVPGYQTATGEELADRTLAAATGEIEQSVTAADGRVDRTTTVDLPERIDESQYSLELTDDRLTLDHPDQHIGGETRLSLPPNLAIENGTWQSGNELRIRIIGSPDNRTLTIER